MPQVQKKKAGVLGATGSVGQRFILLLADHPNFELYALGASPRSAGKLYKDAVDWRQTDVVPDAAAGIKVSTCESKNFLDCDVVFSGLDSDVAGSVESEFRDAGLAVISNAKNHRQDADVPLIVPLVNIDHLKLVQEKVKPAIAAGKKRPGFIVCISNCSTAGLVVPLKALVDAFGPLSTVIVTTMQAVSGAGFSPGVSSMSILDNVIPYISGEEEKLEQETQKILGSVSPDNKTIISVPAEDMKVSAQCNRVAVIDGHMECVSLKFAKHPAPSTETIKKALQDYKCEVQRMHTASAPKQAIHVLEQPDRPQPRLDRNRDAGFAVSVGRVRPDPVLDTKFVVLSHNTVLGAAGSGVLIAEAALNLNLI